MDIFQDRLASFSKTTKRIKASLAKSISTGGKWPHPASFKAKPSTLAEAGFYFNPSAKCRDSVTCFICGKELSQWEPTDDPFEIHWLKCGRKCAWAIVRCGLREDMNENGNYVFPDLTRLPTSKMMEKARLETFTSHDGWPHDDVRGHGASSKKMAKAGFVYTPQEGGDDTVSCFYCGISLDGWKEDDDPLEEHRKRGEKKGELCPFFPPGKPPTTTLAKSTSKVPSSRAASKPPTRSTSRTAKTQPVPVPEEEDFYLSSESDLTSLAPSTVKSKAKGSTRSKASTSKTANTPGTNGTTGSRRSTRGTGGKRKTPASQDATGSEQEEQVEGSGSEAGKRVSKSKKGTRKGKNHIAVIEEEEEEEREDVPDAEEEEEVVVKPKRGRPPGSKKAQIAGSSGKAKKVPIEQPTVVEDSDSEAPPAPMPARTRSKANLGSESEVPKSSSSKSTYSRTKSAVSSAKLKTTVVVESDDGLEIVAERPLSGKGRQKTAEGPGLTNSGPAPKSIPPAKGRTVSKTRSKAKRIESDSETEISRAIPKPRIIPPSTESEDDEPPQPARVVPKAKTTKAPAMLTPPSEEEVRAKGRKSSNTSDDAGYATAELVMDVDEEIPAPTIKLVSKASPVVDIPLPTIHGDRDSGLADSIGSSLPPAKPKDSHVSAPKPAPNAFRVSSAQRAASIRPDSRIGRRETVNKEIVAISSDDEPSQDHPPSSRNTLDASDPVHTDAPPPPSSSTSHSDLPSSHSNQQMETPKLPSVDLAHALDINASTRSSVKSKGKTKLVVEVVIPVSAGKRNSKSKRSLDVKMTDVEDKQIEEVEVTQVAVEVAEEDRMHDVPTPPRTPAVSPAPELPPSTPPTTKTTGLPGPSFPNLPASPDSFIPLLAKVSMHKLTSLTEEEYSMTIEQYINREMERQYQLFKEDGERRIEEFKRKSAETRKILEAS